MNLNNYLTYIQEQSLPSKPSPTLQQLDHFRKSGYRPNVGVAIISSDNHILMAYSFKWRMWFMPQGGIDNREKPEDAVKREVAEEVGNKVLKTFTNDKPVLVYTSFTPMKGAARGSRELKTDDGQIVTMRMKVYFYYVVRSKANSFQKMTDPKAEFQKVVWMNGRQFRNIQEAIVNPSRRHHYWKMTQILTDSGLLI